MRASTEEFLYDLWFAADVLLRPSLRNALGADFEAWAWRQGLTRRLGQLQQRKLLELDPASPPSERIVRLTEAGRLVALGGRDPAARWARPWDGQWRIALFDLPSDKSALRARLHRLLRQGHFGYLQRSVWITPDPVAEIRALVTADAADPEGFVVFEGRPATGESDAQIVAGAWNFAEINTRYERHRAVLQSVPRQLPPGQAGFERVRAWRRREHIAWKHVLAADPLLPLALLPADYAGRAAWSARCETFAALAKRLA